MAPSPSFLSQSPRTKPQPFSLEEITEIAAKLPTPFHLYDEESIAKKCRELISAFSWSPGFINYFAVKATPNTDILRILDREGFGFDCSSLAELHLASHITSAAGKIMFTSNETPLKEYEEALSCGAIINLDDFSHIAYLEDYLYLPDTLCFRYNPGPTRTGNVIIGDPKEAKFGMTREQLLEAYTICKKKGVKHFGLHTMMVSNCIELKELLETARMVFQLVLEVKEKTNVKIEFVNLGGGIGVNYRPDQSAIDLKALGNGVKSLYDDIIVANSLDPLRICYENGRFITGPSGVLVSRVIHQKDTYKKYIGVDACMANLMRPGLYGADCYHHISVAPCEAGFDNLPKRRCIFDAEEKGEAANTCDVVGGLCENNDKFAVNRHFAGGLPRIGDLLIFHDSGAHGHSMGFNYNGKLRSAEYLKNSDGKVVQIRRAETYDDLFQTLTDRPIIVHPTPTMK